MEMRRKADDSSRQNAMEDGKIGGRDGDLIDVRLTCHTLQHPTQNKHSNSSD